MNLTGDEIRQRLSAFAARWSVYDRSERGEAQTFLNELFECYGQSRKDVGAFFEEPQEGKFLDLIWPSVCIIEMKAPKETSHLSKHREQALGYWRNSADVKKGIQATRFVVLCSFRRIEVWEPGVFPNAPRLELDLIELPEQYDALLFLAGDEPVFVGGQAELTRAAVGKLTSLYTSLSSRAAAPPFVLRDFILQCVWCMFAEDLGQIPGHKFSTIVGDLINDQRRSSADDLGQLFEHLNRPGPRPDAGMYAKTPYANGGLFQDPARVHLLPEELEVLAESTRSDWSKVEPAIFGSLLEGGLGHENQWALGAHYTHEADIQKIVQPTIVRPWRERIENVSSHAEAVALQNELINYVVLDPACGSGNFLYVAYREIKRLEKRLHTIEAEQRQAAGLAPGQQAMSFFPLSNIKGIEIDAFAVALARVTLWMGHKLAVDELDLHEPTLPLADLSGISQGDALINDWPKATAIIGNPPFHGSQNVRRVLGDEYAEWLKKQFGIGLKDYCVYWFRKAHDLLEPGERAGLVGTNSVSQNRARGESLQYIVDNGGVITDAVSTQKWPGEAKVHVSIVNWVKQPAERPAVFMLDGEEVDAINTSLRAGADAAPAAPLAANKGRCFQGPIPVGDGFVLTREEAESILARGEADYRKVVRPYIVGEDIAKNPDQQPSRFVIDFGYEPLEWANQFPETRRIVEERVRPFRKTVNRAGHREYWWRFGEARRGMRTALQDLDRFIVGTRVGKRILFTWAGPWTCPSDATNVFAFDDDYSMGILTSMIHTEWARAQSSTLKGDIRYTPTTAFQTFPWPQPTDKQREAVAAASRAVYGRRAEICRARQIGLTTLYNEVDDGAYADLKQLHRKLDEAVAEAYGWPKSIAQDPAETNARLLKLNYAITARELEYEPFNVEITI